MSNTTNTIGSLNQEYKRGRDVPHLEQPAQLPDNSPVIVSSTGSTPEQQPPYQQVQSYHVYSQPPQAPYSAPLPRYPLPNVAGYAAPQLIPQSTTQYIAVTSHYYAIPPGTPLPLPMSGNSTGLPRIDQLIPRMDYMLPGRGSPPSLGTETVQSPKHLQPPVSPPVPRLSTVQSYQGSTPNVINRTPPHSGKHKLSELDRGSNQVQQTSQQTSSIAGTIYKSSAVYKRLKPSSTAEGKDPSFDIQLTPGLRPQGRPFSSSITGRFLLHENAASLLHYMNKKNTKHLIRYQFKPVESPAKTSPAVESADTQTSCRFEDIDLKVFGEDPVAALDSFLNQKHAGTDSVVNMDRGAIQHTIIYKPNESAKTPDYPLQTQSPNGSSQSIESLLNDDEPKSELETVKAVKKDTGSDKETSDKETAGNKDGDDTNFHNRIKQEFGIDEYQFVKAIRDSNGHVLKLESICPPRDANNKIRYSAEWVKRTICYPRYKGGMKIHILRNSENFILYNDPKMMLWDIHQEGSITTKQHQISDHIRDTLFAGRTVYIKLD